MKRLLLIAITIVSVLFFSEPARACQCTEYGTPVCAAYWRADAVFVGQLRDITPVGNKSDATMSTVTLHFIVEQPFRGVTRAQVEVATLSGTSCDMKFHKGKRYLIYASLEQGSNQLFAGPCSRTTELSDANEDLNYLRAVTGQGVKESIAGRILLGPYQALSGLGITLLGGEKTLETTTNEEGDFSLSLPGPGAYKIRVSVPFAAAVMAYQSDPPVKLAMTDELTTIEYEVQIAKNHCDYWQLSLYKIDLHATAEVSGNVLTAADRPVNPGYVYLVDARDPDRRDFKQLEENGSFKFESVRAGEYYLVLNPRNEAPGERDAPFPRTYFPNAAEPDAATRIVITEGAILDNLILRVGQPWKEQVVSGSVVWQDKRSVEDAHVSLYDADRYIRMVKVDEKGRFSFSVYGDFKYAIQAEAWGETQGKSERVSITNGKSTGLKLVLKR